MNNLIAGVIGFIAGALIVGIGAAVARCISNIAKHITDSEDRLKTIEEDNQQLKAQLDELTALKERSRQTGPTIAGLEDALAVIRNLQYNREIEDDLLDACGNKLMQLREGPYAYDPETPSGVRKEFK